MLEAIGQYILVMIGCTLLLFLVHELFRRFVRTTSALFGILLFSFPLWISSMGGWFLAVKTLLMILSILIISLARLGYALINQNALLLQKKIPLWAIYTVLILNIAVALIPDVNAGNYYNAVAGLLLCILVPTPPKGWRIDASRDGHHDLLVDLPLFWCLLYTSWWLNLVYDVWPGIFSRGICLMAVTLIPLVVYKRSDLWLSVRAYTLAFYMVTIAFFDYSIPAIDSIVRPDDNVKILWGVLNLILHTLYAIWWFGRGQRKFKEQRSSGNR
jgi:hypothetical protein